MSGCSLIGLAGGSILDARKPASSFVPTGRMHAFRAGDSLGLVLRDSTVVTGRYAGFSRFDHTAYRERFARALTETRAPALPRPGDPVQVIRTRPGLSGPASGEFLAFLAMTIELRERHGRTLEVPFSEVRELRWNERRSRLTRDDLARLRLEGKLPLASIILVETDSGAVALPLDGVAWVGGPTLRDAGRRGFILGLAADAMIVVAMYAMAAGQRGVFESSSGCEASPGLYSAGLEGRMEQAAAQVVAGREDAP